MRGTGLVVALALGIVVLPASPARACFNVTQAQVDANTKKVKAAEASLEAEDHAAAHKAASEAIGFLKMAKMAVHGDGKLRSPDDKPVDPPDPNLLRRAHRIDALAVSRGAKSSPADRENAMKSFESNVLVEDADPSLLADYAELLSRVPSRVGQATMTLRMLNERDLIGSANAFLALAKIEKAAGRPDAERAARDRCRTAATKKAICDT